MRTGTRELWALGEVAGVIPSPPDPVLADLLTAWWSQPRTFGCESAREAGVWTVVAPSPVILCPDCAVRAFETVKACVYCKRPVRPRRSQALVYEMNHDVRVLGRAHKHCAERARKEPR